MANNCYNSIQFYGKIDILKKIKSKFDKYEETNFFNEFGDLILDKKFDPNDKKRDGYEYGTRWFEFDIDLDDKNILQDNTYLLNISGDSAWSPPEILIHEICKKYKVNAEMFYEEGGADFMGETTFTWTKGVLIHKEECYPYREGMYNLSDNWLENTLEDIYDGLYSIVHNSDDSNNYSGGYFYDQLMLVFESYVTIQDRNNVLDELSLISDKELDEIINNDYRKNDNSIKDKNEIREVINKTISEIKKDYSVFNFDKN